MRWDVRVWREGVWHTVATYTDDELEEAFKLINELAWGCDINLVPGVRLVPRTLTNSTA